MRILLKNVINEAGSIPIIGMDSLYIFRGENILDRYNFDLELIWSTNKMKSQYVLLESSRYLISYYTYERIYNIDRNNGVILEEFSFRCSPKYLEGNILYGEIRDGLERSIVSYDIDTKKLEYKICLAEGYFCSAICKGYILVRENKRHKIFQIMSLSSGKKLWEYETEQVIGSLYPFFFSNRIIIRVGNSCMVFDLETGTQIWHRAINIDAFDEEKGLIYVFQNDFIVIDAITGEEVIRVKDWSKNQLEKYPALFFGPSPCSLSEEYLVFSSRATFDEFGEGGIFFIDKETAEVKEYFRIVFDKDPVQRIRPRNYVFFRFCRPL